MRIAQTTRRFRKDYKKLKHSGKKNIQKLRNIMEQLIDGKILDATHRDHLLQGEWKDFRDCHIEGDWMLIYKLDKNKQGNEIITFCATDNHANLFE